jgi:hypothetical protein
MTYETKQFILDEDILNKITFIHENMEYEILHDKYCVEVYKNEILIYKNMNWNLKDFIEKTNDENIGNVCNEYYFANL